MAIIRGIAAFAVCAWAAIQLRGDDWPQWRGPARNGVSQEGGWLDQWPEQRPPRVAWRAEVGKGHSAVSVLGDRAYSAGWDGEREAIYCLDVSTGRTIWKRDYPSATIVQWPGPRATPTVADSVLYMLGQHGELRAWDAVQGEMRWSVDLPSECEPDVDYGFAWSPLIEGDLLLLNAGQGGLALRTSDGSPAWGDDRHKGACVSAVPFEHGESRAVLMTPINDDRSAAGLVAVEPATGREIWRFDGWQEKWGAIGVDPVVSQGRVFLTSAQEHRQAAVFRIVNRTLELQWTTQRLAGYTGGAVFLGDSLYLVDSRGVLHCVDWQTGKDRWVKRGFDERGTLIAADGMLLIQCGASGDLVAVAGDPRQYQELRRCRVFEEQADTFTAPVLANGRIYCRSYAGQIVCLDLRPQ